MIALYPLELCLYAVACAILGATAFYAALVIRENARRERERLALLDEYRSTHVEHFVARQRFMRDSGLRVLRGGRGAA